MVGQNLSDFEIGLILLALNGFNSEIYPISLGARTGRGYGRMKFTPGPVHRLKSSDLRQWVTGMLQGDAHTKDGAGYFALPQLSEPEKKTLLETAKSTVLAQIGS